MKAPSWASLKWGFLGLFLVFLLIVLAINFTSTQALPDLVRVQIERYAVCSYWFFGWHLASTGVFALFFFLLGLAVGALGGWAFLRRWGYREGP
ncbi:MAG: hypothetical protein C4298_03695 [Thermus sp.]|uniref:hypothetical protein n=1 Tax=Thermus sp. TaxID=275 RepID=UPI00332B9426